MRPALLVAWFAAATATAEPPNLRRVAAGVLVGGSPTNPADWRSLAELGVRTVVGVDGLPPDAASARRHGMRVIHVPIGYGGVSAEASAQLTRVAAEAERPLYVYCHHGRHRGPAAAAIVCRAAGLLNADAARRLLDEAGTDPKYKGLWRDVEAFTPPTPGRSRPKLHEASPVPPLRLAMSQLDTAWDRATSAEESATRLDALILAAEAMRESRRAAEANHAAESMMRLFDRAIDRLDHLDRLAADQPPEELSRILAPFSAACVACHAEHRDGTE